MIKMPLFSWFLVKEADWANSEDRRNPATKHIFIHLFPQLSSSPLSLTRAWCLPFISCMVHLFSANMFPFSYTQSSLCSYLRLFPPLLEAGLGVLVETIWQWTVPSSNMSQMAPNTSVVGIPWGWGMVTYRTAAATAGEREESRDKWPHYYFIKQEKLNDIVLTLNSAALHSFKLFNSLYSLCSLQIS